MKNISLIIFSALFFFGCGGGSAQNDEEVDVGSGPTIIDLDLGLPGVYEAPTVPDEELTTPEKPNVSIEPQKCKEQVLNKVKITWEHGGLYTVAYKVYIDNKPITVKEIYLDLVYSQYLYLDLDLTGYGFLTCDTIYIRVTAFNSERESEFSDEAIKEL